MKRRAVCNSTPIIVLYKIDSLEFLNIFDELIIPDSVLKELELGEIPKTLENVNYKKEKCNKTSKKFENLDEGEAKGLTIVEKYEKKQIFLTDDLEARKTAKEENIEVHGSVGIIVLAYSFDKIDLNKSIDLMKDIQKKTDLFITDEIINIGISELKKLSNK